MWSVSRAGWELVDRAAARDVLAPAGQLHEVPPRLVQYRLVVGELLEGGTLGAEVAHTATCSGSTPVSTSSFVITSPVSPLTRAA